MMQPIEYESGLLGPTMIGKPAFSIYFSMEPGNVGAAVILELMRRVDSELVRVRAFHQRVAGS